MTQHSENDFMPDVPQAPHAPTDRWMIYGATGYTGRLIAAEAARRGMNPIIAGRNRAAVEELANQLDLEWRAFAIDSVPQLEAEFKDIKLVLNCAGPFISTADTVVRACIRDGTHYLDIAGEPDVFEQILAHNDEAKVAGSVVIPGTGFDVVPSDMLANSLVARLPDATTLEMAFYGNGDGSAGSAKTVLGMMADKCKVRRDGKLKSIPLAALQKQVQFSDREAWCMSVTWGDICSAWHSTGIPNITMYMATTREAAKTMRRLSPLTPLLGIAAIRRKLFAKIEKSKWGPDADMRESSCMRLWGKASNTQGDSVEATVDTLEGFTLTTLTSLRCVEKVLSGAVGEGGCYTPTQAFGTELALGIPGTVLRWRE